jgi:uncharacterized protein (DUF2252 family)
MNGERSGEGGQNMRDAVQEFQEFNRPFARRNAELMRFKIERMAAGPFAFFRGTFHLFARDVLNGVVDPGGRTGGQEFAIVGDLHSENYGTFKAEDRKVHYDVNDFDEMTSGRFDFDVCRLATSWFLAAREPGGALGEATGVVLEGIGAYVDRLQFALKKGKSADLDVSESVPSGCAPVDEIVTAGAARHRPEFIEELTEAGKKGRVLRRSRHYYTLPDEERQRCERLLADYLTRHKVKPAPADYYAAEDVCGRVAGVGSMGRYRYAVLLKGKGSAEGRNVLLEFKEGRPSGYDLARGRDGGDAALTQRAAEVVEMQRQSQAASSGHLGYAVDGGLSFQVRELGPADARVDTKSLKSAADLDGVAKLQGGILARVHARAARNAVGPANPLADVADADLFRQRVLGFALRYSELVVQDSARFTGARAALDDVASWAGPS